MYFIENVIQILHFYIHINEKESVSFQDTEKASMCYDKENTKWW